MLPRSVTDRPCKLILPQRSCPNAGFQPGPAFGAGRGVIPPRGGFAGGFRGGFAGGAGGPRPATCYKCGGPNHYARDCQAQAMKCYACGKLVSGGSEDNSWNSKSDPGRVTSPGTAPPPTVVRSTLQEKYATSVDKPDTSLVTVPQPRRMVRSDPPMLLSNQ